MPLPSYLLRRDGGQYYFQLRLGKSLAVCLKRSHLRFALRTTDSREARRRLVDNLGWAMTFKEAPDLEEAGLVLTRQLDALVTAGPPRDYKALEDRRLIEDVVASFLKRSRESDFDWAGSFPGLVHLFKVFTRQNIDAERGAWAATAPAAEAQPAPSIAPTTADLSPREAEPIASKLSEIKTLLEQLAASGALAFAPAATKLSEDLSLSAAKARFLAAEAKRKGNEKAEALCGPVLDFLVDFLGDAQLSRVTAADLERADAALPDIPHLTGFDNKLRKSLHDRYLYAREHGWEGLRRNSTTTLELRYQTPLRRFFAWLIKEGLYGGPQPAFNGKSDEMLAVLPRDRLDDEELIRFASSALFTGCDGPTRLWKRGRYFIQSDLYWIFLILLLTGMRTGEPPQIGLDDIVRVDDKDPETGAPLTVYFFDLRPYDPAQGRKALKALKHLKRADFSRVVPIHPLLIELGLLERVERLRKRGETRLFPGWEAHVSASGEVRWGKRISRAFEYARKRPDIDLKRANICLYATRHLMADWLDSLNAPQRVRNRVMGHMDRANDEENAADVYGGKGMMPLDQASFVLALETPVIKEMREILMGAYGRAERGELTRMGE